MARSEQNRVQSKLLQFIATRNQQMHDQGSESGSIKDSWNNNLNITKSDY